MPNTGLLGASSRNDLNIDSQQIFVKFPPSIFKTTFFRIPRNFQFKFLYMYVDFRHRF